MHRLLVITCLLALVTAFSSCASNDCIDCPESHFGPQPGGIEGCAECTDESEQMD